MYMPECLSQTVFIDYSSFNATNQYTLRKTSSNLSLADLQLNKRQLDIKEPLLLCTRDIPTPSWQSWLYIGLEAIANVVNTIGINDLLNDGIK